MPNTKEPVVVDPRTEASQAVSGISGTLVLDVLQKRLEHDLQCVQTYLDEMVKPRKWDTTKYDVQIVQLEKQITQIVLLRDALAPALDPQHICMCTQGTAEDVILLTIRLNDENPVNCPVELHTLANKVWEQLGDSQGRCEVCKEKVRELVTAIWRQL